MITVSKASIASALMLGVTALGAVEDSFAQSPQQTPATARNLDGMISDLALPVGRTASYFNSATKTALRESCVKNEAGNSVQCTMQVMGVRALMHYTDTNTYRLGNDGRISVSTRSGEDYPWNQTIQRRFDATMKEASSVTWRRSSPLATMASDGAHILQNDVIQLNNTGPKSVHGLSIIPVSEKRGIAVSQGFDRSASSVSLGTLPVISAGAIAPDFGQTRPFTEADNAFYSRDKGDLGSHDQAYALRP